MNRPKLHTLQRYLRSCFAPDRQRPAFPGRSRRSSIECLESRIAPAIINPVGTTFLYLTGDDAGPADDHFTIQMAPNDPTHLQVAQNGGNPVLIPTANVSQIFVSTGAGNDSLTLDFFAGSILGSNTIGRSIAFDGGTGFNTLSILNGNELGDVHSAGPQVGQGSIQLTVGTTTSLITYQNLAPVNDYLAGPLTINGTNSSNSFGYVVGRTDDNTADAISRGKITIDNFEPIQFSNKTVLTLNGLGGDDHFNLANQTVPIGLTNIVINGSAPGGNDGDSLTITGSANAETFDYVVGGTDSGTLLHTDTTAGITQPPVTFAGIDSILIDGKSSINKDALSVHTGIGQDHIVYTPGPASDAGLIQEYSSTGTIQNAAPLAFKNLSGLGTVSFFDTTVAGTRTDILDIQGTAASDAFAEDSAGTVSLNSNAQVLTPGVAILHLIGGGGSDVFGIAVGSPVGLTSVDASGSGAGAVVHVSETAGVDVNSLTLSASADVLGVGSNIISMTGVGSLVVDGSLGGDSFHVINFGTASSLNSVTWNAGGDIGDSLTVTGTLGDDHIDYTPLGAQAGLVSAGVGPVLNFTTLDVNAHTFTLDPTDGVDTVTVHGTAAADAFTAGVGTIQIGTNEALTLANLGNTTEAVVLDLGGGDDTVTLGGTAPVVNAVGGTLSIQGGEGNDALHLDFTLGNPIPSGGITFDGGAGSDSLTLSGGAAASGDIYTPGPVLGSGSLDISFGGPHSTVHFANLEPVVDLLNGTLTVVGNGANNAFTYSEGSVTTNGLVNIDGQESIEFSNKTNLNIDPHGGNDTVTLDNAFVPTGLTGISILSYTLGGTTVDIQAEGPGLSLAVGYTPTSAHSGIVTGAVGVPVSISGADHLSILGNGHQTTLNVVGSAGSDLFTVTPGTDADSGSIGISADSVGLLPISFSNLGAAGGITLTGSGGSDELVYLGTSGDDSFVVDATTAVVHLATNGGSLLHTAVTPVGITQLTLSGLGGNDSFSLDGDNPFAVGINILAGGILGGNDQVTLHGASGVVEDVNISKAAIGVATLVAGFGPGVVAITGASLVTYEGADSDDTLTVEAGSADSNVRVSSAGAGTDEVDIASLPTIHFTGLDTFVLDTTSGGAHTVTFKTQNLSGAADYEFNGNNADTLVIEGADGAFNDSYSISKPAVGSVAVTDLNNGVEVTATGELGRLEVDTLGGDDTVAIHLDGTGLITVPIHIDGGTGHNTLTLDGTPTTTVTSEVYSPADGRIDLNSGTMVVDIANVSAITDTVSSDSLTVNGTNGPDTLDYSQGSTAANGKVSVNAFPAIEFSNKTTLALNGLAGDDVFSISNGVTPNGLTSVTLDGGNPNASDHVIFDGTAGDDTFTYTPTSANSGSVAVVGLPTLTFGGIEDIILNGLAGDDTFKVGNALGIGNITIYGGAGSDTVDFSDSNLSVNVNLDKTGVAQRISSGDQTVTFADSMENFVGSDFDDIIKVAIQPFARLIDGGDQVTHPPGDTLIVDAEDTAIKVKHTGAADGTATSIGYSPVTFTDVETVQTLNTAGGASGGTGSVLTTSSFSPAVNYFTGAGPRSVQSGDVNGDGFQDLVVSSWNHNQIAVLLGTGQGTFGAPHFFSAGAKRPTALVLGDFDGDSDLDLAVTNGHSKVVTILANDGNGNYSLSSSVPVGSAPRNIIGADLNSDGKTDLVVVNSSGQSVSVLLGAGGLSFGGAATFATGGHQPRGVAATDIDGDGKLDIVVSNAGSNNVAVLLGNGNGSFGAPVVIQAGKAPLSLVTGDFNQDGKQDIATSDGLHHILGVLINSSTPGSPSFAAQVQSPYPHGVNPQSLAVGDFNFDGVLDVVLAGRKTDDLTFLVGQNNGTFLAPVSLKVGDISGRSPAAFVVADLNNDGADDVAVADHNSGTVSVLLRHI